MRPLLFLFSALTLFGYPKNAPAEIARQGDILFTNQHLVYAISADGQNRAFRDRRTGLDYAVPNLPCAQAKRGGKAFPASSATFKAPLVTLKFGEANVQAE